ncbi:hypothetical protein DFA_07002 [Cavenderia fasciculata]|uniref:Uncharacterized protein n=1 Tax=Cavenderia fasciculata TaxID=261658 RepID=F4PX95_CACFS|nr:uncharacterized protein DFA_07002 [Cavenderia fasciculata]EGG19898.1 hypothetical protein DFA_07002 [Cavenderia fasciculata]|eukprot:XP_004366881.1 hypothetical protein DFA_07002 [Cavenderia fasciculata]
MNKDYRKEASKRLAQGVPVFKLNNESLSIKDWCNIIENTTNLEEYRHALAITQLDSRILQTIKDRMGKNELKSEGSSHHFLSL